MRPPMCHQNFNKYYIAICTIHQLSIYNRYLISHLLKLNKAVQNYKTVPTKSNTWHIRQQADGRATSFPKHDTFCYSNFSHQPNYVCLPQHQRHVSRTRRHATFTLIAAFDNARAANRARSHEDSQKLCTDNKSY